MIELIEKDSFPLPRCYYDIWTDGDMWGCTDTTAPGKAGMQHHVCPGMLWENESCSGVSETPADPDVAE